MIKFIDKIKRLNLHETNDCIRKLCGIVRFFDSDDEKDNFISFWEVSGNVVAEDKVSYGDWQTPESLANDICLRHKEVFGEPDVIIEPTCGRGSFVLSSLRNFTSLSEIHAVEINSHYTCELKRRILYDSLYAPPGRRNPDIFIYTEDFFKFDFSRIFACAGKKHQKVAVIGNPPWVTNSTQGTNQSDNVPFKENKYGLKGIDAITGKSNFDISEAMMLTLLALSDGCQGGVSMLLKNSVIRNIVMKQRQNPNCINEIVQHRIDANKEFHVSVDASCMTARLGVVPSETCEVRDYYTQMHISKYGWFKDSFVSNLGAYGDVAFLDGKCPYIWRSGIKHDCADVLELDYDNGRLYNKLGEVADIEGELVFPLMKSSDVAKFQEHGLRKYILVPQRFIGEGLVYLERYIPKTHAYLMAHKKYFEKRKSSIYKGKGPFSIFGIGDYSFMPYKIVISALYKDIVFSLVGPWESKPVIVDDTCYQIGFNNLEEAEEALSAFRNKAIMDLIHSLIFMDSKRVITKSLLMRLDVGRLKSGFSSSAAPLQQLSLFE